MHGWIITLLVAFTLYAIYATLYFGWLTATPLAPSQLRRAQNDCYCWFWFGVAAASIAVFLSVRRFRKNDEPLATQPTRPTGD